MDGGRFYQISNFVETNKELQRRTLFLNLLTHFLHKVCLDHLELADLAQETLQYHDCLPCAFHFCSAVYQYIIIVNPKTYQI